MYQPYHSITNVEFILSSISSRWLFWSVNHTSIYVNSELNVFKGMKYVGASSTKLQKGLLGTNVYKTFETCWCPYWQCCYKLIILL